MNIIKQIKLYREVKDYLLKSPNNIRMGAKMYGTYGDLTTFYEIDMKNVSLTAYQESDLLGPTEYWAGVRGTGGNVETCYGMVAKAIYKNIRNVYNQRFRQTTTFGIGR